MTVRDRRRSWRFAAISMTVLLISVLAWAAIQYGLAASEWTWVLYVSAVPIGLLILVWLDRHADPVDADAGAPDR